MEKETHAATSWASLVSTPGNIKRMAIVIALAVFSQWRCVLFWDPAHLFDSEGVRVLVEETNASCVRSAQWKRFGVVLHPPDPPGCRGEKPQHTGRHQRRPSGERTFLCTS